MKTALKLIAGLFILLVAYLFLWPVPINPVAWDAKMSDGYAGDFAPNTDLANLERLSIGNTYGPEDVAGRETESGLRIYTSGHDGDVIEIDPVANTSRVFAKTGGVPLGIEFGPDGTLYVADAYKGLLAVDTNGTVAVLTNEVDGTPIAYADDLDIGPDGVVYFSDASTKFGAESIGSTMNASLLEIIEHKGTGRVLAYDPATEETRIVKEGFVFSNGVAMGPDGESILVNETGTYSIHRIWVGGPNKGKSEIIIDNLPGFPDNINPGPEGTFLVGLISQRSDWLDKNSVNPGSRKLAMRLPASMRPQSRNYGHIVQIDADGNVLRTWQDPSGDYIQTTGAIIASDGYMYVSSLAAPDLARKKME